MGKPLKLAPPLTPPQFWDPLIIEGDPNDPRNLTQPGKPFQTRVIIFHFVSIHENQFKDYIMNCTLSYGKEI